MKVKEIRSVMDDCDLVVGYWDERTSTFVELGNDEKQPLSNEVLEMTVKNAVCHSAKDGFGSIMEIEVEKPKSGAHAPLIMLLDLGYTDFELAKLVEKIENHLISKCENKVITDEEWSKKYCHGDFCNKADNFYFDKDTGEVLLYW